VDGKPTPVTISRGGEDVRQPTFTSRLAIFVKTYVPLCSFDWRTVDREHKDTLIRQLKVKKSVFLHINSRLLSSNLIKSIIEMQVEYDWGEDPHAESHILKHAARLHKDWRVVMKKKVK